MKEKKNSFRGKIVSSAHRQKESKGRGYLNLPKGIKLLKLPEDIRTFTVDFLPYKVTSGKHPERNEENGIATQNSLWYRLPYRVHQNVGANKERLVCPQTFGHRCPICEYQLKRIRAGANKEEFKLLYPQERSMYVVVPLHKDYDEAPYIWDMADFLFQDTLIADLEINEENEDFFTLDNGKTTELKLKWKEIGKTIFPEIVSLTFKDREQYDERIMKEVPQLDEVLKILPFEEIESKFFEIDTDKQGGELHDEEVEEEESPRPFHRKKVEDEPSKSTSVELPVSSRRKHIEEVEKVIDESVEETIKEEKPTPRMRRETKEEKKPLTKDRCPYGHKFGVDTDAYDDCNTCEIWDDCVEELEKHKK